MSLSFENKPEGVHMYNLVYITPVDIEKDENERIQAIKTIRVSNI